MDQDKNVQGMIGAAIAAGIPFLEFINPCIQVIAGVGGLVLLFYSIRYKMLQVKELKNKK